MPLLRFSKLHLPILAVLIVAIMMVPAELWHHPTNDAVYNGFDSNLVYSNTRGSGSVGGVVTVSPESITLKAIPGSQPTVTLVTTPLSVLVRMDVTILLTGENSSPLTLGVWTPEKASGYFIIFGQGQNRSITSETRVNGTVATTLLGGHIVKSELLGHYSLLDRFSLDIGVDRKSQTITSHVIGPKGQSSDSSLNVTSSLAAREVPQLFQSVRLALTAYSTSQSGIAEVVMDNYQVALLSQRWLAYKIDDARVYYIVISLLLGAGLVCIIELSSFVKRFRSKLSPSSATLSHRRGDYRRGRFLKKPVFWIVAGIAYVGVSAVFFGLGNGPFDVLSEKLWSYIASSHSITDLYHWPLIVPSAQAWKGEPRHELPFAYNYVLTYYFALAGWAYKLVFSMGGPVVMDTFSLEFLIKSLNVLVFFVDGLLVYSILMLANLRKRTASIATSLFLFDPALWIVPAIWGTTEPVTIFFILLSIWAAEKQNPVLAWISVGLGALTRPQMVVPSIVLAAVYLKKFGFETNVRAISLMVISAFIVLAPFALSIGPSLPLDYEYQVYSFHVSQTANEPGLSTVSGSAYSVWPLITKVFNNAWSLDRFSVLGTTPVYGPLNYANLSAIFSFGLVFVVALRILVGPKTISNFAKYMPLVAFATLGFFMLKTEIVSRYFFYGLALVIVSRKSLSRLSFYCIVSVLTFTTFVTVYASIGYFDPSVSALTGAIFYLWSQDSFITLGSTANLAATALVGIESFRTARLSRLFGLDTANADASKDKMTLENVRVPVPIHSSHDDDPAS